MSHPYSDMNMPNNTPKRGKLLTRQRIRAALSDVSDLNSMENFKPFPKPSESFSTKTSGPIKKCPKPPTNSKKTTYKHVPHSQKPAHLVARRNERERKRVQAVNTAFFQLRKHVPHEPRHKRLSKFKTLKVAIHYIRYLQDMIQSHDIKMAAKHNCANSCHHEFLNQNNKSSRTLQSIHKMSTHHPFTYFNPAHTGSSIHHNNSFDSLGTGSSFEIERRCMSAKIHDQGLSNPGLCFDEHLDSSALGNGDYHQYDSGESKSSPNNNSMSCLTTQWLNQGRNQSVDNYSTHSNLSRSVPERANYLGPMSLPCQSSSQCYPSPDLNPLHRQNFSSLSSTEIRSHSATPDSMTSSMDSWNTNAGIPCSFMHVSFQENSTVGREISSHSSFFT